MYKFWQLKVQKKNLIFPDNTNPDRRDSSVPEQILRDTTMRLAKLRGFCDRHPMYKSSPHIIGDTTTTPSVTLSSLYDLLVNLSDAIEFVLLMIEYNLSETIASISKGSQQIVFHSTFEQLITSQQVRSSWHDLVLAIIRRESGPRVDNLSRNLERRCPTFCNAAETKMYQGYEALQKAKKNDDEHTTREALRNSLKLFCECIDILTYGTLNNLCLEYNNFGFYEGSIELLLKAAQSFDLAPEKRNSILDLVIDTLRDAGVFVDGVQRNAQSYNPVLQKALNLGTSLNDKTFLFAVYDEFLKADSIPQLFTPPAPYLEDYLDSSGDLMSPISRKKMDLYCDFCITHNQFLKAAIVKEHIAKNSGNDVGLQDRLHYLSHAVGQAESAKEISETTEVIETLNRIRKELKIAKIQYEIFIAIDNMNNVKYNNIMASTGKPDKSHVLTLLNQQLFDGETLLREFAIPFDLVESELSIVHAIEVNPRRIDIDNIWAKIIRKASQRAIETGSIQPIADIILESARKFYPHDLRVFPLSTIVRLVATYLIDNRINEPYFITRILRQANVAYGDLFNTYHQLYTNRVEPFNNSQPGGGMELLFNELAYVLNQWIKSADERYDIVSRSIHGYISEYLTTVSHFAYGQDLAHEFLEIQRKLEAFSTNMFE
ncbi:hypothetical protein Glove_209g87 [Diversispora epigaea]|uniref:Nucleoporin Nup133/Nup155-like C-terminal domain-containing protein n=1 Tax=Diversispora epigaea TaxID=1348612 RepID=A0A397IRI8_9GLOM|nr:hypothetical protein Glove_209g87 [Diversispora epigaea]